MQCILLGCGSSRGTPEIGCGCITCSSGDPKNKRSRSSILISTDATRILVDTGPDFRAQALSNSITQVDAIIYTHLHADHIAGIDDVKPMCKNMTIPVYTNEETAAGLVHSYGYAFKQSSPIYPPLMRINVIDNFDEFMIGDVKVQSFAQTHGGIISLGLRFGDIAYSTDVNMLSEKAFAVLEGVKVWIVDCMRYSWAPTHSHLERTLGWISRVKPEQAILTHINHEMEYNELKNMLPANVAPGYDGMVINL